MSVSNSSKVGDTLVQMDRRRKDRRAANNGEGQLEAAPVQAKSKKIRRRQIDPTTCERDYNNDEIEFMHALDAYKRSSGRMFPTCSEILEVIRGLGYTRPNTCESISATATTDLATDDEDA